MCRKLAVPEVRSRPLYSHFHVSTRGKFRSRGARNERRPQGPMETRSLYLAAYDVAHPRRLRAALALVKGYSTGGQKSVHECFLSTGERNNLMHDMSLLLEEDSDRFLLLRLDPRARVLTLGKAIKPVDSPYFYLG